MGNLSRRYRGAMTYEHTGTVASELQPTLAELAVRIASGDEEAVGAMYSRLMPGLKMFFLARRLDAMAAEDCAHEAFLQAVARIRAGALECPASVPGYVRTIASRIHADWVEHRSREVEAGEDVLAVRVADVRPGPEEGVVEEDRRRFALEVLKGMSQREREVLVRFYLWEQDAETICGQMGLTADQFRLLKWRAKARFAELGQRRLKPAARAGLAAKVRAAGA